MPLFSKTPNSQYEHNWQNPHQQPCLIPQLRFFIINHFNWLINTWIFCVFAWLIISLHLPWPRDSAPKASSAWFHHTLSSQRQEKKVICSFNNNFILQGKKGRGQVNDPGQYSVREKPQVSWILVQCSLPDSGLINVPRSSLCPVSCTFIYSGSVE